eukprot:CAMPEP_0198290444 /NCGR_PEP_ID=MMETSP1449-20131203/8314_1 /TAXON_ID=420275 /ORGANISM="Attheya septentrionalis, Strain CCMP2084" /LENGTH=287 /DNA_ID=CAMNT_0043988949 /DNA_START=286 /DNA_END=1149 /DNA_ORIENTATION=-
MNVSAQKQVSALAKISKSGDSIEDSDVSFRPYFNMQSLTHQPSLALSDVSSEDDVNSVTSSLRDFGTEDTFNFTCVSTPCPTVSETAVPARKPLQWEFYGLTIWVELEEFDSDLSQAIAHFNSTQGVPLIPQSHTTAIYGMTHLTVQEAKQRLRSVKDKIPAWPKFAKPVGVVQDIAVNGQPGQVCSIAWAELTLATNPEHEAALDILYEIFHGPGGAKKRVAPWKPHNSVAYDNPEDSVLNLADTITYMASKPTILGKERRVQALSLWNTEGKMEDWECLDRIHFF